ncbi:hypothetical protein [Methylosinus sp. Sm6]|uniref:hypothetical protein n=1 Tax=Methylosinus sp. Sm6 TaxID=2866948 RepID=UPI001C9930CC|nr:hypothetical protein [Methylosinus sp. Sm6]MBY6244007.1 hypothetical protein [Methylosinus sp. Sm6]
MRFSVFMVLLLAAFFASGEALARCHGCGCRGGPGYRNPRTGQCVGKAQLRAVCGSPPTSRCIREGR